MESEVFILKIKSEKWPDIHHCKDTRFMPYNGALFCVSDHYSEVFEEDVFKKRDYHLGEETYKIKYELNILPFIGMHIDRDG
jgi:hypothetical protein